VSQVLPANLLWHGLFSLTTGLQVLPGACSSVGSACGLSLLQGHPPALAWGPPQASHKWISAPLLTSMGCRGISAAVPGAPQNHRITE